MTDSGDGRGVGGPDGKARRSNKRRHGRRNGSLVITPSGQRDYGEMEEVDPNEDGGRLDSTHAKYARFHAVVVEDANEVIDGYTRFPFGDLAGLFEDLKFPYENVDFAHMGMEALTTQEKEDMEKLKSRVEVLLNNTCPALENLSAHVYSSLTKQLQDALNMVDLATQRSIHVHAWVKKRFEEVRANQALWRAELTDMRQQLEKSEAMVRELEKDNLALQKDNRRKAPEGVGFKWEEMSAKLEKEKADFSRLAKIATREKAKVEQLKTQNSDKESAMWVLEGRIIQMKNDGYVERAQEPAGGVGKSAANAPATPVVDTDVYREVYQGSELYQAQHRYNAARELGLGSAASPHGPKQGENYGYPASSANTPSSAKRGGPSKAKASQAQPPAPSSGKAPGPSQAKPPAPSSAKAPMPSQAKPPAPSSSKAPVPSLSMDKLGASSSLSPPTSKRISVKTDRFVNQVLEESPGGGSYITPPPAPRRAKKPEAATTHVVYPSSFNSRKESDIPGPPAESDSSDSDSESD